MEFGLFIHDGGRRRVRCTRNRLARNLASRPLSSHLAPIRRAGSSRLHAPGSGREVCNKRKSDSNGPFERANGSGWGYLKPCKWTTYHSPRHEMSDVSSNSRDRPVGSVKRKRARKTRK